MDLTFYRRFVFPFSRCLINFTSKYETTDYYLDLELSEYLHICTACSCYCYCCSFVFNQQEILIIYTYPHICVLEMNWI